ncbi:cleavage and polyadenylation specificity factor subunit 2 isoform X2 [Ananas comosus]|uniref:Cleavage and polyadenylation specificity factor subunit 2 n=1 Tax=Ananas comosus TaxID=4615 RepID=A0A6P5E9B1_ANACO|nr:cleavage and polyadenylation specificity factor subunit 2 isoform X2 [Ananas comosus]
MGTSVQVTPLCGVYGENPLCYLLSIDGFNFLMDCGWNDLFDLNLLQPLSRVASKVDAVLLSHPDILHLGALPYAMKHLGLSAPVYSTEPVYRLGLLTMYDHYLSRRIKEKGLLLLLMWLAIFWEVLFGRLQRMERMSYMQLTSTIEKNEAILKALRADGTVLLPVDTAGRALELILILEQYWDQQHLSFPIFFLTNVATSTIDYVKSFLEWMSDSIAKSFGHTRDNAFLLKHVTLIINRNELDNFTDVPKVVLASMASLEVGFSHDIFVELATDAKNLVLFTEKGQFGTLARMLQVDPPPKAVKVIMSKRIPLVGDELKAYEEEQERIKKEATLKASLVKEEESRVSHGSDANVADPMVIDVSSSHVSSNIASSHLGGHMDIVIDGFVPPSTSVAPMFPFFENTAEWDDYGEVINPDDYIRKEEDMDQFSMLATGDGLDGKLDEGSAHLLLDSTPSKVVSSETTVQVKCALTYMDFEGRSDGRSVKSILAHVAPLKLVLVHGSAEATEHLKMHCVKHVCPHVYAPQIEETIDVTSDLCAYKVQLSEKLMSNVLFKKLGEHEISWVDAEVGKTDDMLTLLPLSSNPPAHKSVLVGDLKLADFKQFLAGKGVQVEFAGGGALRCGEYVTLRKISDSSQKGVTGAQQIAIEGPLCEEYYKIRDLLYSQFYSL